MQRPGADLYFRDPAISDSRVLIHARFEAGDEERARAVLDPTRRFSAGQEVLIYYERDREFVQQPVRIETLEPACDPEQGPSADYAALGEPVSAESRQHYRVSVQATAIEAQVGADRQCLVQDLSATGFAAMAAEQHKIGNTLHVGFSYDGVRCEGTAIVQSSCERREGNRYGFLAADADGGAMRASLNQISLAVQREQLKRISGG